MIEIIDKKKCCGCAACVQVCPQKCISFEEDERGFSYPFVNKVACIGCGLCERVCPEININEASKPIKCFASINNDSTIRKESSSGGVFSLIAEKVISEGGVVFGALFNNHWEIQHGYTETKEGLARFRGSKYVQSKTGETYQQVKSFLKQGRMVLYSGTSCQIAGLKKFLRADFDNLITIDVVCHGVPSPLLWRKYLEYKSQQEIGSYLTDNITKISFRDKRKGWKRFGLSIKWNNGRYKNEVLSENLFLNAFLKNLSLRPSCACCVSKEGKAGSDISLADYWGIGRKHRDMDDDKGTSLVLVNTEKGLNLFASLNCLKKETAYQEAFDNNPSIEKSVVFNENTEKFWNTYQNNGWYGVQQLLKEMRPNLLIRTKNIIINYVYRKLY